MRNHNDGSVFCKLCECLLHFIFIIRICKCCCLIQNNNRRIFQNDTRNCNSLLFPTGEIYPIGSDNRFNPQRKFLNNIHALSLLQRLKNFFFCCVRSGHSHIFQNRSFYQPAVLKHKRNCIHQIFFCNVFYIYPPNIDITLLCIKKSGNQICQRCFSTTRRSYESHCLS